MLADLPTHSVIGLDVALVDYSTTIDWCIQKATASDSVYAVAAANTHVAALARRDPQFRKAILGFDLICPDGWPLVWSVNRRLPARQRLFDRVYGPTLMDKMFEATRGRNDIKHFLLGGKPTTLENLEDKLEKRHPNSQIVGTYSPPCNEWPKDESSRIIRNIQESQANMIWVGLGCPKQEQWISENRDNLPPGIYFGVGAAFSFLAGEVRQAPFVLQKLGLEWLFRVCVEPRRLFRRYLVFNSLFIFFSIRDCIFGSPGVQQDQKERGI